MIKKLIAIIMLLASWMTGFSYGQVIKTVYGDLRVADDDETFKILHKLPKKTGLEILDISNSISLIEMTHYADGALGEIMGNFCIEDFTNKPRIILSLYLESGAEWLDYYFKHIAWEFCMSTSPSDSSKWNDFNNFVKALYANELNSAEKDILDRIIASIKKEMVFCFENY